MHLIGLIAKGVPGKAFDIAASNNDFQINIKEWQREHRQEILYKQIKRSAIQILEFKNVSSPAFKKQLLKKFDFKPTGVYKWGLESKKIEIHKFLDGLNPN